MRAAGAMLVLSSLFISQAHAAGVKRWTDHSLHIGLSYPANWRMVTERGAVLKLVAPDAASEFEIFALSAPLPSSTLAARALTTLTGLHCATELRYRSGTVGRLIVAARSATGTCTGADRGWKLTAITFNYGSGAILIRSWLFHAQPHDGAALVAITASLAPNS